MPPPVHSGHRVPTAPQPRGEWAVEGSLGYSCHPVSLSPGHGVPTLWTEVVTASARRGPKSRR